MCFKKLFLSLLFLILASCASDTPSPVNKTVVALPAGIQKLALGNEGALRAYVIVDNDDTKKQEMLINPAGAGSASIILSGLSREVHNITIRYEYTLRGETYVITAANRDVDLTSGAGNLDFSTGDYNFDAFDEDEDGYNNAIELIAGTSPNNSADAPIPVALGIDLSTLSNTALLLPIDDIDKEGHPLSFTAITLPANGSLNGKIYTPNIDFSGTDNFTYQLSDGIGNSIIAQINIDVTLPLAFITTWKTDNQGTINTGATQIKIGTNPDIVYNFNVDWGDGTTSENVVNDIVHTYDVAGTYTVQIRGRYPQPFFGKFLNSATPYTDYDASKIISIDQWGDITWESMSFSFYNCNHLKGTAIDIPELKKVIDMSNMFLNASIFNQDINNWDVSSVINMSGMFRGAALFNQNLDQWNVSSITDMRSMFNDAKSFNRNIDSWDVSSVTNMNFLFNGANSFNGKISSWNVSSVTSMINMFNLAGQFNQDISQWNVSSVKSMFSMFNRATSFNQNLINWNINSLVDMSFMFTGAQVFNQNIGSWNVSNVSQMPGVFSNATAFNQDISGWNVSSALNMREMFDNSRSFDQDLSQWNVSQVSAMDNMFRGVKLSTFNYDALLTQWSSLILQSNVIFDGGNSTFSAAVSVAKDVIINDFNWVISDGGQAL